MRTIRWKTRFGLAAANSPILGHAMLMRVKKGEKDGDTQDVGGVKPDRLSWCFTRRNDGNAAAGRGVERSLPTGQDRSASS